MHGVFHNQFIGSGTDGHSNIVLLGCPLDITSSFRNGSKFGPESLRRASWTLETYSPYCDRDLEDINFADMGDLELPQGNLLESLEMIENASRSLVEDGQQTFFLRRRASRNVSDHERGQKSIPGASAGAF